MKRPIIVLTIALFAFTAGCSKTTTTDSKSNSNSTTPSVNNNSAGNTGIITITEPDYLDDGTYVPPGTVIDCANLASCYIPPRT